MKDFKRNLIKELICFVITLIIFIILLFVSSLTILNSLNLEFLNYLILVAHFIGIYILILLFTYLINRDLKFEMKTKIAIHTLILGILILSLFVFSSCINIINPVKHISDIFIETILFNVFPYYSYILLISILIIIYLIFKIIILIKNNKKDKKDKDNKKKKEKEDKDKKKVSKETKKDKTIEDKKKEYKFLKYIILIVFFIVFGVGMSFKIIRLNSVYLINMDEDNTILTEIESSYKDIKHVRKLDLSKIDSDKKEKSLIKSIIYNESQVYIVIPEGYKKGLEISRMKNTSNTKKIIFISLKNEDRNIEYQVLLNRIRENAIVYEIYGDFTETKDILNKFNTEYEINIK